MKLVDAKKRLMRRYVEGVRDKVIVLEQGLREFEDGGDLTIRRLSHQIAGSAKSFGFPDLGDLAAKAELAAPESLKAATADLLASLRGVLAGSERPRPDVLVVDDDRAICDVITSTLTECVVHLAHSTAEARRKLAAKAWDVMLLDVMLPDGDGRALLGEMRGDSATQDTPVVVLSHRTNSLVKNECAALGVESFLEKPLDLEALPHLIASITRRQRAFQQKAYDDDLTQLLNRAGFRKQYKLLSSLCRRNKRPMSVAMLDLDNFKQLNDDLGHQAGDTALKVVSNMLTDNLRESDLIGRWGGEEFVVAMPETDLEGATQTITKLAEVLRREPLTEMYTRAVTFSAGVAEVSEHELLDQALHRADQGMYIAKKEGRDRVRITTSPEVGGSSPTVLLAEDDPDLASLLIQDLGDAYNVTHVTDGTQALKMALQQRYDLLILDYHLPGKTGVEVAESLRSSTASQGAVLLLTSVRDEAVIERAFAAGAIDYIRKPYRKRELLARVGRHVAR